MKTTLIAVLAILSVSTMSFAYADVVPMPQLPTDNLTGVDVKTFYPTNSTYIVQISVYYTVEHPIEVLNTLTWLDETEEKHVVLVKDAFTLKHFPPETEPEVEEKPRVDKEEIQRILAEKKAELQSSAENGFSKLRQCLEEFEVNQPVRFEAWVRIANLTEFSIPDAWINSDHYERSELEAQKKWVICDALKKYKWIGAWEANRIIDSLESQSLVETDDPRTVPVTPKMIQSEIDKAEAYKCSDAGKSKGHCTQDFTGENRGTKEFNIPFWYAQYQNANNEVVNKEQAINKAMVAQCQNFYPLYEHKDAEKIPSWLGHCIP